MQWEGAASSSPGVAMTTAEAHVALPLPATKRASQAAFGRVPELL
jgi:hypothetical protein